MHKKIPGFLGALLLVGGLVGCLVAGRTLLLVTGAALLLSLFHYYYHCGHYDYLLLVITITIMTGVYYY